jgi:hypothetical protein
LIAKRIPTPIRGSIREIEIEHFVELGGALTLIVQQLLLHHHPRHRQMGMKHLSTIDGKKASFRFREVGRNKNFLAGFNSATFLLEKMRSVRWHAVKLPEAMTDHQRKFVQETFFCLKFKIFT